jgi:hypothetical protein
MALVAPGVATAVPTAAVATTVAVRRCHLGLLHRARAADIATIQRRPDFTTPGGASDADFPEST